MLEMTDQQVIDLVPCPVCAAKRGEWCPAGEFEVPVPHIARVAVARVARC